MAGECAREPTQHDGAVVCVFGRELRPLALDGLGAWFFGRISFSEGELVRLAGLEPARVSPLPPQSSVSANSTISATGYVIEAVRL